METTTLNIRPDLFWGVLGLVALVLMTFAIFRLLPKPPDGNPAPLERVQEKLGLSGLNGGMFFLAMLFWCVLSLSLVAGLLWVIWQVILSAPPIDRAGTWDWRFLLAQMVAMTGVLGAVIAFPITLVRIRMTREQTLISGEQKRIAEEALFNDKLKAAADDLHARRDIRRKTLMKDADDRDFIEDDIVRRVAAIDRLQGLAEERPSEAPRITRLLCVYLRQLSEGIGPDHEEHPRADMEAAAQTIGRMKMIEGVDVDNVVIDLRGANFARFDLSGLCFDEAFLLNSHFVETNLRKTKFRNARFYDCTLQPADMRKAHLQGARLSNVDIASSSIYVDRLLESRLRGASLRETGLSLDAILKLATRPVFMDSSVLEATRSNFHIYALSEKLNMSPTSIMENITKELQLPVFNSWREAYSAWRVWQRDIGFDPDDPQTWS